MKCYKSKKGAIRMKSSIRLTQNIGLLAFFKNYEFKILKNYLRWMEYSGRCKPHLDFDGTPLLLCYIGMWEDDHLSC